MSIRYYFSWLNMNSDSINSFLSQDIKQTKRLVCVPTDLSHSSNEEGKKWFSTEINSFLNRIGVSFEEVIFLTENMSAKDMKDYIVSADVVILLCGEPSGQLSILNDYGLVDVISSKPILIGWSAGAMCMSKYSVDLIVNDETPVDIRTALNLSGMSVFPHYNTNGEVPETVDRSPHGEVRKSDVLKANQQCGDIYLLNDESCIRECNGELTFIGDGIIHVSDGQFKIIKPTEPTERTN